ncbi:helix-turn-helix transcriptional regulator [bacterium]|nr:helix-turn-helix transcriptional regulator [bacterium]
MSLNIKKQIGQRIKTLRANKGLSQEQLAEKLGIAPRTLCGIEIGKNFFTASTLEKILEILEITPQDLFKINHLQPQEDLVEEIITTIKNIKDREKIEIIYKIIKAFE